MTAVSASETTGDIATVCDSGEEPLEIFIASHIQMIPDVNHDPSLFVSSGRRQRPALVDGER